MAKGGTNWDSTETWKRVVASIIASGVKLDMRAVAKYYGTTYDTLENRFRTLKKDAIKLKAEVDSGERGEATPTRTKSAPSTPRKPKTPKKEPLDKIANGRVTKATPKKRNGIKQEQDDASSSFDDLPDSNIGAFNLGDDDLPSGVFFAESMGIEDDGFMT